MLVLEGRFRGHVAYVCLGVGTFQSVGSVCDLCVVWLGVEGGLVTEVCHSESSSSQAGHQC